MTDYSIKRYSVYSDDELVKALRDVAARENLQYVSGRLFSKATGISEATVTRHFRTWAAFCRRAGLAPRYARNVEREDLLANLDRVWQRLGRQPRAKEMKQPLSPISISKYQKAFGASWHTVCLTLVASKSGLTVGQLQREVPRGTADAVAPERRRRAIIEYLKNEYHRTVPYGVAAKLVSIYAKGAFVLSGHETSSLARHIHQTIDSILLTAIDKASGTRLSKTYKWQKLDRDKYIELIGMLRKLNGSRPFWAIELHWKPWAGAVRSRSTGAPTSAALGFPSRFARRRPVNGSVRRLRTEVGRRGWSDS